MSFLRVEVLIEGPQAVIDEIEHQTKLRRAPRLSEFSLERLVPFPLNELASRSAQTALAERVRDEVLMPWRRIINDVGISPESRKWMEIELANIVIRACEGVSRGRGIPDTGMADRWRLENWGCDWDVAEGAPQRPLGDADPERIHVSLPFESLNSSPPLIAFDALAARWPAVTMTVAWDGGEKDYLLSGCGLATWRHGVREDSRSCPDDDRSERCGRLHSIAPLRLAKAIRDSALPTTECRPTLRIDLTEAELEELTNDGTVELEVGPDHTIMVGGGDYAEFETPGYRLGPWDYFDPRGIGYDEVWRRVPGSILGMRVALTLHCAAAVDVNRAETILTIGSDPLAEYVREEGII